MLFFHTFFFNTHSSCLQVALETHIQILLGCLTNASVPEAPDTHVMKSFELRIADAHKVDRFRALYVDAPIALPLAELCTSSGVPDWKTMPEAEFMERYGNAVRAKYNLPTKEELNLLHDNEVDNEEQEEPAEGPNHPNLPNDVPANENEMSDVFFVYRTLQT